jgi:hypothetical protein
MTRAAPGRIVAETLDRRSIVDYTVEYIAGIFVCTPSGDAEVDATADLLDAMSSHEKWKPGTPFVHDISMLKTGSLTVNDIKRIADLAAERRALFGAGKIAVAASRDPEYGLARMLSVYISESIDSEFKVFRSRNEALAWLSS